ncbi:DUF3332 domain-containing protein [Galbibacter pacificus]|uniref:DUF3332 domain-containing protein n=1 Tax=Galbibacter pacificus TaxID=2996052 RepID=A0ABT6FSP7_9FLAO|nr:DUF3332 domain-containing protein [Galbibacter pacificus]MDG3582587.1 DUF3332 domain-containing protein [Galbibacter pacificus]MDG3586294.1 DUF3332 domain-containing protein [Galbibacter pacificus]
MKKVVISGALAMSILCSSCLGSFSAFNGLKDWNQGISGNKFVNNLVFWALWIVPVYEIFMLGDLIIFNVIEFWTGSNPIAMKEGEKETQVVEKDGNTYKMTATKNRMQIAIIAGPRKGEKVDLVYKPDQKSWSAIKPNGEVIELASFKDGFYVVNLPNGEKVQIDPTMPRDEAVAYLKEKIACDYSDAMLALSEE